MRRGTKNNVNFAGKCLSIIIVWCMVLSGFFGLLMVNVGTAIEISPETNAIPEIISGIDIVRESKPGDMWIYDHDGPLTITADGSLTLINYTLNFLQDGGCFLNVNGGSTLKLVNSTITTGANFQAVWWPFLDVTVTGSNLIMEDHSAMAFPGSLTVTSSDVYVNDSWITGLGNDFTEDDDFPGWSGKFLTTQPVLGSNSTWFGAPVEDDEVDWNDGPLMTFIDCDDVTIAGSRIDMLYENSTYPHTNFVPDRDTRFVLDNTEMSIINSYISLDWLEYNTSMPWKKNIMVMSLDSHVYAYNMTLDHTYGTDDNPSDSPYIFIDTSELYYYKWAEIPVVDYYDNPIEDAFVNFTFEHTDNPPIVTYVYDRKYRHS